MMRFKNQQIPNWREIPVYPFDRILEAISLIILASLWVVYFMYRDQAPDMIPTHFDAAGNVNGWSSKPSLWLMPAIGSFIMLLLASSAYYFKLINLPVVIDPKTIIIQFSMIARMMRWVTLITGSMFFIVNFLQYSSIFNISIKLLSTLLMIDTGIFMIFCIFYTIKINSIGKRASNQE